MSTTVRILALATGLMLPSVDGLAATADNPYHSIAARNLFGLKDPPPPAPPGSDKPAPPPITLQGFTTILGKPRVLFKISQPAKPPQPAAEVSKIMSAGERDGEVTVLEINLDERSAKFDNYGTVEVRNMKDHAAKPAGGPVGGGVPQPGIPQPGIVPQPAAVSAMPAPAAGGAAVNLPAAGGMSARAAGLQTIPTRPTRTVSTAGSAGGGVTAGPQPGQNWPPERVMTPEEQEIMIEIERERNKNNPNYPPLPPTSITPNPTPAPTTRPQ